MRNGIVNRSAKYEITLTHKAGAYVSGRVVGTLIDLTSMCGSGGGGMILQINVADAANQKKALKIYFFGGVPSTKVDDDVFATSLVIGDINKLIAVVDVAAADYVTLNSLAYNIIGAPPDTDKLSIAHGTGELWAYVVTNDTPNYGVTNALTLKFIGWKD